MRFADDVAEAPGLDAQMLGQLGGDVRRGRKAPDKALRLFNRAIEQEPQRSKAFRQGCCWRTKTIFEAEDTIRSGIKIGLPTGYYYLGRIGVEARDFDKATRTSSRRW